MDVCREGVPRTHLIDATLDGSLFLELYTRDGVGTMVSKDLYEGMRAATLQDVAPIMRVLKPLEDAGTLKPRTFPEVENSIGDFTIIEREGKVIGCCCLRKIADAVAEITAFAVHENYRTEHRGDALLDFVEQRARAMDIRTLLLLTTRTGDWFKAREFEERGPAYQNAIIPAHRRGAIDPKRKSILFVKELEPRTSRLEPPGSRIGF